jgi:hypothetical protein
MLGGYLEFFMSRDLASTYLNLKNELESLIHRKVFILNVSFYSTLCYVDLQLKLSYKHVYPYAIDGYAIWFPSLHAAWV